MPSLELHGENVAPNAKAIAMAPTRVIWRQGRVGSRRSTCEDDREGQFHTQAFERYQRYEPHIAEGLTQMFVAGVSTQKVGEVAETLMGVAPSASTISRLNQSLTHQYETWRQRPLQTHWRVLYLDGVHFSIRHGEKADATIILTALGVDLEGNKEVLARRSCAEESKEGWLSLLQDVRTRGATQIDLLYFGDQLPDHCLGDHSGYPLAQNLAVERLGTESTQSSQQPAREGGSRGGGFCASRDPLTSTWKCPPFLFGSSKRRTQRDLKSPAERRKCQRVVFFSLLRRYTTIEMASIPGRTLHLPGRSPALVYMIWIANPGRLSNRR